MLVNSLCDGLINGEGLFALLYGATRSLPEMVADCTLAVYRPYRKIQIAIEQVERAFASHQAKMPAIPPAANPLHGFLPAETGRWA